MTPRELFERCLAILFTAVVVGILIGSFLWDSS